MPNLDNASLDAGTWIPAAWVLLIVVGAFLALVTITLKGPGACRPHIQIGLGCLGAAIGQVSSDMLGIQWVALGDLQLLQAFLGAILLIAAGRQFDRSGSLSKGKRQAV
jgi:hypothetical protein